MKKVQIEIIVLLLIILITAGGYYFKPFVSDWSGEIIEQPQEKTSEEPKEELSFEERVKKLDSAQKLVNYLNEYYTFEEREGETYAPKEFFKKNKGGNEDFASFSAYALQENEIEAATLFYEYDEGKTDAITVFRGEVPSYISFSPEGIKKHEAGQYAVGRSFKDTLEFEEERLNIQIKAYKIFLAGETDFSKGEWNKMNSQ